MNQDHHLRKRGKFWSVRYVRGAQEFRISTKSTDIEVARAIRDKILSELVACNAARMSLEAAASDIEDILPDDGVLDAIAQSMFKRAKSRAKVRKLGFQLSKNDVRALLVASGWRCAVSGIRFEVGRDFPRSTGPFKPSLDRIDCSKPYVLTNVRLVCCAANLAMNVWGLEVLRRLAAGVVGHADRHRKNAPEKAGVSA